MDSGHPLESVPCASLLMTTGARSRRESSWDRSGGNRDFLVIGAGQTAPLLEVEGPGCVTHLYCALALHDITDYRNAILRCFWDGAANPSVEVPLGDFFGIAHGRTREFSSAFLTVNRGMGTSHGLNAYFPMPFADGARVTLENRGERTLGGAIGAFWYHVEYETYDRPLPDGTLRFHAGFAQEDPTTPVGDRPNRTHWRGLNLDGAENYVALDTQGEGQMVGLLLEIENRAGGWYGEGDDMVFIDGDTWPPSIHGTGTEEIFGGGACPSEEYASLYSGFHLVESPEFDGLVGMYRWWVADPIRFRSSLRWTLEHGHANNFGNRYSSVAYWYQQPLAILGPLPDRDALRPPGLGPDYEEARDLLFDAARRAQTSGDDAAFLRVGKAGGRFYAGDWRGAIEDIRAAMEGPGQV